MKEENKGLNDGFDIEARIRELENEFNHDNEQSENTVQQPIAQQPVVEQEPPIVAEEFTAQPEPVIQPIAEPVTEHAKITEETETTHIHQPLPSEKPKNEKINRSSKNGFLLSDKFFDTVLLISLIGYAMVFVAHFAYFVFGTEYSAIQPISTMGIIITILGVGLLIATSLMKGNSVLPSTRQSTSTNIQTRVETKTVYVADNKELEAEIKSLKETITALENRPAETVEKIVEKIIEVPVPATMESSTPIIKSDYEKLRLGFEAEINELKPEHKALLTEYANVNKELATTTKAVELKKQKIELLIKQNEGKDVLANEKTALINLEETELSHKMQLEEIKAKCNVIETSVRELRDRMTVILNQLKATSKQSAEDLKKMQKTMMTSISLLKRPDTVKKPRTKKAVTVKVTETTTKKEG